MNNKTQHNWQGTFWYDPEEYGMVESVHFELYLEMNENHFNGVCYDEEFRTMSDELPKVIGSFDNSNLTFQIIYPLSFSIDEEQNVSINAQAGGHTVYFMGKYDSISEKWVGTWEIPEDIVTIECKELFQLYSIGRWEMLCTSHPHQQGVFHIRN